MIQDFIIKHLKKAKYELIEEGKRFYAEINGLKGVWATGDTLEECRNNLLTTIEGWLLIRIKKGLPIPDFKVPSYKLSIGKYA